MDEGNEVKGLPKVAQKIQEHPKDLQPEPASLVAGWSRELHEQARSHKDERRWSQQDSEGGCWNYPYLLNIYYVTDMCHAMLRMCIVPFKSYTNPRKELGLTPIFTDKET